MSLSDEKAHLITEPHDGHEDEVTCPGCPHEATRVETVEWGMTDSGYLSVPRTAMTEDQARSHLEFDYQQGHSRSRLRRRTVVTITGPWEYVPSPEMDGREQSSPPGQDGPA